MISLVVIDQEVIILGILDFWMPHGFRPLMVII